jgi:hypothetical protein
MTDSRALSPARWLMTEFDATDPDVLLADRYDVDSDSYWRPVFVQAMFTLKPDDVSCWPMRVTLDDYADPLRWWM